MKGGIMALAVTQCAVCGMMFEYDDKHKPICPRCEWGREEVPKAKRCISVASACNER